MLITGQLQFLVFKPHGNLKILSDLRLYSNKLGPKSVISMKIMRRRNLMQGLVWILKNELGPRYILRK